MCLQNHAWAKNRYSGFPQPGKNVNTLYINKGNRKYRDIELGDTIMYEYEKKGNKYNIGKAMNFEKNIKSKYDNKVKILVHNSSKNFVSIINCKYIRWTEESDGTYYLILKKI